MRYITDTLSPRQVDGVNIERFDICSADGSTHTESNKLYRKVKHRYRPNLSPRQRPTAKSRHDQAALAASAEARGATHRARPRSPSHSHSGIDEKRPTEKFVEPKVHPQLSLLAMLTSAWCISSAALRSPGMICQEKRAQFRSYIYIHIYGGLKYIYAHTHTYIYIYINIYIYTDSSTHTHTYMSIYINIREDALVRTLRSRALRAGLLRAAWRASSCTWRRRKSR